MKTIIRARVLVMVTLVLVLSNTTNAQISFTNETDNKLNPARTDLFVSESWGVSVGDLEGDHWPDVYVTNHRARPSYYRNTGNGSLVDNTLQVDLEGNFTGSRNDDRHGAVFSDFDGDGDHDLFGLQAWIGQRSMTHEPLFIVGPDGRFKDEGLLRGLAKIWGGNSYAFDVNADGKSDVVRGANDFSYFAQDANGNFGGDLTITDCKNTWINIADYDGDQIADLLCYQEGTFPKGAKSEFGVWQADIASIFPTVSNVVDGLSADLDNDLDVDVVLVRGATLPNQVLKIADDRLEASVDVGNVSPEFRWSFTGGGVIEVRVHSHRKYDAIFGVNGVKQAYNGGVTTITLDPSDPDTHGIATTRDSDKNIYFGYDPASNEWTVVQHSDSGWWYIYMEFQGDASLADVEAEVGENGLSSRDLPSQPRILKHENGSYINATAASNMDVPIECGSVAAADFDNDMDLDIYAVCSRGVENLPNRLFENQGDGTFLEITDHGAEGAVGAGLESRAGQGESVATGDFDNDGFMDVFLVNGMNSQPVRTGGGPHEMILNTSGNSNNWIHLELRGSGGSDINAVGARVVATAAGVSQLRYQDGGFHRWSQNHDRIHFGLGSNNTVDLEIRWPDGQQESFPGIASNGHYLVTQGSGVSAVTLAAPVGYPAPAAGDECGEAPYWPDRDQGIFVYKDCVSDTWKLRASGGGQQGSQIWTGMLASTQVLSNITGYSLEGGELVDNSTNPSQIAFSLTTSGAGEDGFDFSIANGANGCLQLSSPASSVPVLFGSQMLPITLPYDIVNNTSCAPSSTPEISVMAMTVSEGDGTADVEVTISSAPTATVSVNLATNAGTATGGLDFYGRSAIVNFPAGQTTSQIFTVSLVNDDTAEATESFKVRLFEADGANIAQEVADITIEDDDSTPGVVTLGVSAITVNEADGVANIEVTTSTVPTQPVSVTMATNPDSAVGGTDFYGTSQVLSFPAGQTTPVIVPITLLNDSTIEPTEVFRVRLFNPVNAVIEQTLTDITIEDDDANTPATPRFTVVTTSVNESTGLATVEVAVDIAPSVAASVKISTVVSEATNAAAKGPGGDFYGRSTTLNFPAGQVATQSFSFSLIDDSSTELDEVLDIRLFAPVNASIPVSKNPLIIIDDD